MHGIDPNTLLVAIAAFFNAVPSIIAAYYAVHARNEARNAKKSSIQNNEKLRSLEQQTNGITQQLVKATSDAAFAKGKEQGKSEERQNGNGQHNP